MIDDFRGTFLSNFWPAKVTLDGETYPTVEHAYQAAKTDDPIRRIRIRSQITPSSARRMGHSMPLRKEWTDEFRLTVMQDLLLQKFAPGTPLAQKLRDTYPDDLVEGNSWGDTFWGVSGGRGSNYLGRLLEDIRERLMHEEVTK